MRQAILDLVKLGPLPSETNADPVVLERVQELITSIGNPIADDEARALVRLFGSDDCFGLAWSVLHLIETAPGWPLFDCLEDLNNEWVRRLRDRALRTNNLGDSAPPMQ